MSSLRVVLLLLALGGAFGCSDPGAEPDATSDPPGAETVAIFDGGEITRDEVDAAIVALPPKERNQLNAETLDRYRELVRSLALDEILLADAETSGYSSSEEYTAELETMYRQVFVHQALLDSPPPFDEPTEAEIRERYEASRQQIGEPEQRYTTTIFRRLAPGQDPAPVVEELDAIRQQVLDGESFTVLAREHSESESRHLDGAIGWVRRGAVTPDLEEIVFGLEEGVPSRPIVTPEGVHLFYVETVLAGEVPRLEVVRNEIRQTIRQERRALAIQEMVQAVEPPADAFVPDRTEVRELLRATDPTTTLLKIDDDELSLGELRGQVDREQRRVDGDDRPRSEIALAIYNGIRQRELLFHHFRSEGRTLDPQIRRRFDRQAETFLVQRYSAHLIEQELDRRSDELAEFHELHKNRFVTLLELRLEALVVPHGDAPGRVMATLERERPRLTAGETTLEALAPELGGEIQVSDWVDINSLSAFRAKAAYFAPAIPTGGFSPPYNTGRSIEIFQVLERREPRPLSFESAREQVREAYLQRHGQALYEEMVERRLDDASFEIIDSHLAELASGRPRETAANEARPSTPSSSTAHSAEGAP